MFEFKSNFGNIRIDSSREKRKFAPAEGHFSSKTETNLIFPFS